MDTLYTILITATIILMIAPKLYGALAMLLLLIWIAITTIINKIANQVSHQHWSTTRLGRTIDWTGIKAMDAYLFIQDKMHQD